MRLLCSFSEYTFRSLKPKQQHKKCAELLHELSRGSTVTLQTEYSKLCLWVGMDPIAWTQEEIEGRFHHHIRASGRGLAEADFLWPSVGDRTTADEWLNIHTYLDGLRSCHNVGSILRTVEAFRLGPVHLSDDMMPPNHPQLRKTSMGAWHHVEIKQNEEPPRPWIALETVPGVPTFNEWIYPKGCSLIVGNEERGICSELLRHCDTVVRIPLAGYKNSLNVANAYAILAAEVAMQHRRVP
jgi:tRNA(Leu) C34 or U34 (ribose-2'-O)-methylase TrmL